jgi:hypothetical protein
MTTQGPEIVVAGAHRVGGPEIGGDAEWVGPLCRENVGSLIQLVGDLRVLCPEPITALGGY